MIEKRKIVTEEDRFFLVVADSSADQVEVGTAGGEREDKNEARLRNKKLELGKRKEKLLKLKIKEKFKTPQKASLQMKRRGNGKQKHKACNGE